MPMEFENRHGSMIQLSPKLGRHTFINLSSKSTSGLRGKETEPSQFRKETITSSQKPMRQNQVWQNNGGIGDKLIIQENQVVINVAKQNQYD